MTRPRTAAGTLARGWLRDGRRWSLGSSLVLAATLIAMVGTSGLLDGTRHATLERVADFYTGDLRITPVSAGAIPTGWFDLNASARGPGAMQELQNEGLVVSPRTEAQFVMSRQGFLVNAIGTFNSEGQFAIDTPGQSGDNETHSLAIGGLIGIEDLDPAAGRIAAHLVEGRLPTTTTDGTVEVAMSVARLRQFLTPAERAALHGPPSLATMCHRTATSRSTPCEITSALTTNDGLFHDLVRKPVDVVGLFDTGIDVLDTFTMVAAASQVRELLGHPANAHIANALLVEAGDTAVARAVADRHHWASEDTATFAASYVGQLIAVLAWVAFGVSALLFLLPTFLVSHGISRQLALQQRELAVCTAIGVPVSTLRVALLMQVLRITIVGAAAAALIAALMAVFLPHVLATVHGTPLPVGFVLTTITILGAIAVTVLAMAIGLVMGLRSRSRLPLTAQLRAA